MREAPRPQQRLQRQLPEVCASVTESSLSALATSLAGRYTVEREIGRGGMATVYLARDARDGTAVAIKVIRDEFTVSVGAERFRREIAIVTGLQHPAILPVLESNADEGLLYYVMPYCEGESLRVRLERERQLSLDEALSIASDVAGALEFAHGRGVVHRDIKPENILLRDGRALVADFGIAHSLLPTEHARLTSTGVSIGTPGYMSPEQATAEHTIDGRSDVYSLACVLYEMLSGELPHEGPTAQAILARQLSGEVRSLIPVRPTVTPHLDTTLRRALAPAPADRFATASAFAAALIDAAATREPGATGAIRVTAGARWRWVGAAVGAGIIALASWWALGHSRAGFGGDRRLGVAVFPLRATTGPAEEWSESLPDLLSTTLDGVPEVRVVDPWALWRTLRSSKGARAGAPDVTHAARLAAGAGATRFVMGAISRSGRDLVLSVRLYATGATEPLSAFTMMAPEDSVPALVQRTAVEVISRLWGTERPPRVPSIERNTTRSAEALKAYLVAREALRRGLVDSADVSIMRAITLDTTFALALGEAARVKSWVQWVRGTGFTGIRELVDRAVLHSDSLSERGQLRARALKALVETDGPGAAEALERLVRLDSTDVQAWADLAYTRLEYGWQFGADVAAAVAACERAVRLDSTAVPALTQRLQLAWAMNDRADVARQVTRLHAADSTSPLARGFLRASWLLTAPDAEFSATMDTIGLAEFSDWVPSIRASRMYFPERLNAVLARMRANAQPGSPRRTASSVSIAHAINQGQIAATDSMIRAGAFGDLGDTQYTIEQTLVASAIAGVTDSAVAHQSMVKLARYIPVDSALARFEKDPVWRVGWLLAAWNAMYGDTATARRWHGIIGRFPGRGSPREWRAALQADIEARMSARRGDLRASRRQAGEALSIWSVHTGNSTIRDPEIAMRFNLARLLKVTGASDSAAVLFRSLIPPVTWVGAFTTRSYYELAEIEEQRRRPAEAAFLYTMAQRSWARGGIEVGEWRELARAGFHRTGGDPRRR